MLTAFQCEVVAYLGDGDIYCPACWDGDDCTSCANGERVEHCDAALIRYSADELATSVHDTGEEPEAPHTDQCGCTEGVYCGGCFAEIIEPYEDTYEHEREAS